MILEMTAKQFHEFCEYNGVTMTLRMAYYIHSGHSRMSYDKAKILSAATGISIQAWIEPVENLNPYLAHLFKGPKNVSNAS